MILIDETKYSCVECIRGHRSSSCYHHTRPLLQVRSKGRPNVYANGNPNHRIAVFAEEVEEQAESSPDRKTCKKNPVIILKASAKQVIDLTSGQIVGPYNEANSKPDASARPPTPKISSDSFINTSTCCSGGSKNGGVAKKTCCACNRSKKGVNKSKILKTYLKRHMDVKSKLNITELNTSTINGIKTEKISNGIASNGGINEHNIKSESFENGFNSLKTGQTDSKDFAVPKRELVQFPWSYPEEKQVFDVVSIPSCSVSGFCGCGEGCQCEGCATHGNKIETIPRNNGNVIGTVSQDYVFNNQFMSVPTGNLSDSNLVFTSVQSGGYQDIQNMFSDDSLYGSNRKGIHTEESMNPVIAPVSNTSTAIDPAQPTNAHTRQTSNPVTSNYFATLLNTADDDSPTNDDCVCAPDGCECTNCETHGIINGFKLDEYFQNASSIEDTKLMALMGEFSSQFGTYNTSPDMGLYNGSQNQNGIDTSQQIGQQIGQLNIQQNGQLRQLLNSQSNSPNGFQPSPPIHLNGTSPSLSIPLLRSQNIQVKQEANSPSQMEKPSPKGSCCSKT